MRKARTILALAGALALAATGLPTTAGAESSAVRKDASRSGTSSDTGIQTEVRKLIEGRPALRDIRVSAERGTVTLEGAVARAAERVQAEELASSVSGVETVENEIRVGSASDLSSRTAGGE